MANTGVPKSVLNKGDEGSEVELLHAYLTRFGYFPNESLKRYVWWRPAVPAAPRDARVFDDRTEQALRSFQRFNGLAEDGKLNPETLALIQKPRCGFPDNAASADFVAQGNKWPSNSVTYRHDNFTADVTQDQARAAIRGSFDRWAAVTPLTFTETSSGGDIRIGWHTGDHGDGSSFDGPGNVLAHAFYPPPNGGEIAGDMHFDDAETWSVNTPPSGFDLATVALHELGHSLGLGHSSVSSAVMYAFYGGARRELAADDIEGIQSIYGTYPFIPTVLKAGTYTIQQKSNNRFVDAHENAGNDFRVVTRTAQNDDTQRWLLKPLGGVYTIRQESSGRYLDAHEVSAKDFALVTRPVQNDDTQLWMLKQVDGDTYTMQQMSNKRFADAHETSEKDFTLVTRPAPTDDTQKWTIKKAGASTFTIQQKSNGRFVDAHENAEHDYRVVTREAQNNATQRWILTPVAALCTLQQKSNGRYLDAHETSEKDFALVTRAAQNDDTQRWMVKPLGGDSYTVQQLSNNRFADAHESSDKDYAMVTRPAQNNDTQRWLIKPT